MTLKVLVSLLSIITGLLLLAYSSLLFLIYVGTLSFSLLLLSIYLTRKQSKTKSITAPIVLSPRTRKSFRKTVVIALVCFAFIIMFIVLYDPWYFGELVPLLGAVVWVVFVFALFRLSWILLFARSKTGYPKWTIAGGAVTALFAAVSIFIPVVVIALLSFGQGSSLPSPPPPSDPSPPLPNAFEVSYRATIVMNDDGKDRIDESYEIRPTEYGLLNGASLVGIAQIRSGAIPEENIALQETFPAGEFDGSPLMGMRAEFTRNITITRENIGFLRSKYSVIVPEIDLLWIEVGDTSHASTASYRASWFSRFDSEIVVEMSKNSFLASNPQSEPLFLPDKDVVTLTTGRFISELDIYRLRGLRLGILRDLMSTSSNLDAVLKLLAVIFWPIIVMVVATLNKEFANKIVSAVKRPFRRDRRKGPMGFQFPGKRSQ